MPNFKKSIFNKELFFFIFGPVWTLDATSILSLICALDDIYGLSHVPLLLFMNCLFKYRSIANPPYVCNENIFSIYVQVTRNI